MRTTRIKIDDIYVPVKRRKDLKQDKVDTLAESILADGLQTPINVRPDEGRYVLVEGFHRLEACRALGEDTIDAYIVQARKH